MPIFIAMNAENTIEIPGLLSNKASKKLCFDMEGVTIEKQRSFVPKVFLPTQNIAAFRYGIKWTRAYNFVFGRQYFIEIQNDEQKITQIKLSSYYSIRKHLYGKLWTDIIQQLWKNYFINLFSYYHELYTIHQTFELCGIQFHFDGIGWDLQNILQWHEIAVSSYQTYFMIYNCQNKKQCISKSFANDWNAVILQVLLKEIVEERSVIQS
jgi:hypothetical protein